MRVPPTGYVSPSSAYRMFRFGAIKKHREPKAMSVGGSDGRTTLAAMTDGRDSAPSACSAAFTLSPREESVIGHEALYAATMKCRKNVGWKWSVQNYTAHAIENVVKLARDLASGRYKEGRTHAVHITYPKKREALAISFRDRTYQRSLNDNALYPQMTHGFIWSNLACQKGKGTTAARTAFRAMLHRAFLKYGTNKFQILSSDIKGYYDNMRHDVTKSLIEKRCDAWTAKAAIDTLERQYRFRGDKGYNPGSQMVQIAGISYLDPFDHFTKEVLRRKLHLRYMDDTKTIGAPDEDMEAVRAKMDGELAKVGLWFHPEKTKIATADKGAVFLGFVFKVDAKGKVLMFRDPKKVKEIRRRMRRMVNKVKRGEIPATTLDASYQCVRACMEEGNSARLLRNMDDFYNSLKGELAA